MAFPNQSAVAAALSRRAIRFVPTAVAAALSRRAGQFAPTAVAAALSRRAGRFAPTERGGYSAARQLSFRKP